MRMISNENLKIILEIRRSMYWIQMMNKLSSICMPVLHLIQIDKNLNIIIKHTLRIKQKEAQIIVLWEGLQAEKNKDPSLLRMSNS